MKKDESMYSVTKKLLTAVFCLCYVTKGKGQARSESENEKGSDKSFGGKILLFTFIIGI